jgi:hypothetical protein
MRLTALLSSLVRVATVTATFATPQLAPGQHAEVWRDTTSSVPLPQLREATREVRDYLPAVALQRGLYEWRDFTFADKAFDARPVAAVTLPLPPRCDWNPAGESSIFKLRNARLLEDCLGRQKEDTNQWLKNAAASFEKNIPLPTALSPKHVCTSLYSLVSRVSGYGSEVPLTIVISDGLDTCWKRPPEPIAKPKAGQQLILVIVTPEGEPQPLEHFRKVSKYWQTVASWVTLIPTSRIESTLLPRGTPAR